jgi:hypothetical protein
LVAQRRAPNYLFVDNGSEFSGRLLDLWAYHRATRIDFSRPGKPTDNCFVETFNGSFRDECLNVPWFETMEDAKATIEAWRRDYNETRPHMALKDIAPEEFAPNGHFERRKLIVKTVRKTQAVHGSHCLKLRLVRKTRAGQRDNRELTQRVAELTDGVAILEMRLAAVAER